MFDSLGAVIAAVGATPIASSDEARLDQIEQLERLRSVTAALQARVTAAFVASQRDDQRAKGVPESRVGRGIASQVGLARRISPFRAARYVSWVMTAGELPETFAALERGETSEGRAMVVARETMFLSRVQRSAVDREVAPQLSGWGDREVEAETKKLAYRLDPAGFVERLRNADSERRVTIRPAPDTMCRLTALLPAAQGVAAYAALKRDADTRVGVGDADGRTRGQVMADTLVERVTGQARAADVPVEVNVIITDAALFGDPNHTASGERDPAADAGVEEPAHLLDLGPVPADTVRRWIRGSSEATPMWLRRLYRHPDTGQLVTMDSRRRCFTPGQRHFIRLRDQRCRTPWCDAPIQHADHLVPHDADGATRIDNSQGYCEACNYAKQAPGWRTEPNTEPGADPGEVTIVTPTGRRFRHRPPPPPGAPARPRRHRRGSVA